MATTSSRTVHDETRSALIEKIITDPVTLPRGLGDRNIRTLSEPEQTLDRYLHSLRQADVAADVITTRPLEDSVSDIRASQLYSVLKGIPKGGNLHVHENHLLSRHLLLDIMWQSPDFPHLYILPEDHATRPLELDFFLTPPDEEPWTKVDGHPVYTKDYLYERMNYIDNLKRSDAKPCCFDTRRRWRESGALWSGVTKIIANVNVKEKYLEAMIQSSMEEGVQYLETKKSFGDKERLYKLDPDMECSKFNGKHFLEPDMAGTVEIDMLESIIRRFQESKRGSSLKFSGVKRLVQSVRQLNQARVVEDVARGILLHKAHKHTIVGFDLAGEDDTGHSLSHHLQGLFMATEYSKYTKGSFQLVLHAGETSYFGDTSFRPSDDTETSALNNMVDAMILNVTRIGHGLAAIKQPKLMDELRKRGIAIEITPACNHLLGFVPDLRNHPAQVYHRSGIPIVLGSDAHGVLGTNSFTLDWYLAYVAWGLTLSDLKQLAYQSLFYSSMSADETEEAICNWRAAWDEYVVNTIQNI